MSAPSPHHPKAVDIRDVIAVIVRRKWLLILPLILVAGVAYGITYMLTPLYRSWTIVWIDKPSNVSQELARIIGTDRYERDSREDRARQLQALQNKVTSQAYLIHLIRDLKLDSDPEIIKAAAQMREGNNNVPLDDLKLGLLRDKLKDCIDVQFVGTDQIQLMVEWDDAQLAKDMVTRLAGILEQEESRNELDRILGNQDFADNQLSEAEFNYKQALDSLTNAKTQLTRMTLPENISSESNRRDITADIDRTNLEIQDYQQELSKLEAQLSSLDLDRTRLKFSDSLVALRAEIDGQVVSVSEMMERYAWNEQNVINVNIRLNTNVRLLEEEITHAVDQQFAAYPENQRKLLARYFVVHENIDILNSKVGQLQLSSQKINSRINQIPRIQAQVDELNRRVEDLRKYKDAFQAEETTVGILSERVKERTRYKVIEPAQIPLAPYFPDRKKIVFMGVLLGLVIGGGVLLLVEIMDNSFKRVEDIEAATQLRVLAAIPKIEALSVTSRK